MADRQKVADLYADVTLNVTQAQRASRDMSTRLLSLWNGFKNLRDQAKASAVGVTAAFSTGLGIGVAVKAIDSLIGAAHQIKGAFDDALTSVADYDKEQNTFRYLTKASDTTMARFSQTAQALGQDLLLPQYSAADAATAMLDLAKAGISAEDAIAAANPTMLLAAGAEASAGDAANLLANTLNQFGLEGAQAARVADLMTGSMKHSGQSLGEMSDALAQGGATFKQANQSLDTFLALTAELGKAGIRGGQAGNTLSQMMLSLISPTDEARGLMSALGVHVYELGTNKMRPFRDIVKEMTPALTRLNDAQRNTYLETIFGSNAIRAASIIFGQGADVLDDVATEIGQVGVAEGLAAAKADSLAGALAGIKKEFATALFTAILPFKDDIKGAASEVGGFIQEIVKFTAGMGKSEAGLLGLATAFAALGAASVASGDLGGGLEYILIAVLLIVEQIIKAFQDLMQLVKNIGDFLGGIFGGGGASAGTATMTVTPVLDAHAREALQADMDRMGPLNGTVSLTPQTGSVGDLSAPITLTPDLDDTQGRINAFRFQGELGLNPDLPGTQKVVDAWRPEAGLTLNPDRQQVQGDVDAWVAPTKDVSLAPARDQVQTDLDQWGALTKDVSLSPNRDQVQGDVSAWAILAKDVHLDPSPDQVQGDVSAWAPIAAAAQLDTDSRQVQGDVNQWPFIRHRLDFDLPSPDYVQSIVAMAYPNLKLNVELVPTGDPSKPAGLQTPPTLGKTDWNGLPASAQQQWQQNYAPYGLNPDDYVWTGAGWAHRAGGGPVVPGQGYIVGEHGPEPFIPSTPGTILPSGALGGQVTVNFYGPVYGDDLEDRVVSAVKTATQKGRL